MCIGVSNLLKTSHSFLPSPILNLKTVLVPFLGNTPCILVFCELPALKIIAKTAFKKIGALIRSMKFLSPEVALYLYKPTIRPCMECCCHVWAGAPSCYLELLDKLQKRICRTVGPSLAASLEPLAHHQNVASLSLFYRYYFGRCSSILEGDLLVILKDCMIFLSPFLGGTRMSMSTVSFLTQLDSGILCL